jgi:hypothetical protein
MFQIPKICIYDIEEKIENNFELEVPTGYDAILVSFIYLFNAA